MKLLILILAISLNLSFPPEMPEKRSIEENVFETVLQSEELIQHFSYLPRYTRADEDYYFLLKNEHLAPHWQVHINQHKVRILDKNELMIKNKNFFITIEKFELKDGYAEIVFSHRYHRLYQEENKYLHIEAKAKKADDQWQIENLQIQKIHWN